MNPDHLPHLGLNIFATTEVSKLPQDILDILTSQNIPFSDDDTLGIIGHGGKALWEHLPHPLNRALDPIDNFSINEMKKLEDNIQILFPHPQWTIPLQRIGRFLNISRPSLLGLDIHKDFGLWFAFRGAFLTKNKIRTPLPESFNSPCEACQTTPCLNGEPANTARLLCPYQKEHQYRPEQIQYHNGP